MVKSLENKKKTYFNYKGEVKRKRKPSIASGLEAVSPAATGYYEDDQITKWAMQRDEMVMESIEKLVKLNVEQGKILEQLVNGNIVNQKKRKSRKR